MTDIPPHVRDAVLARDEYRCVVCGTIDNLHLHHLQSRAQLGTHDPTNLVTVCWKDHERLHRGLLRIELCRLESGVYAPFVWGR